MLYIAYFICLFSIILFWVFIPIICSTHKMGMLDLLMFLNSNVI